MQTNPTGADSYTEEIKRVLAKPIVFRPSPKPTMGVELELAVVDAATGLLVPRGPEIIAHLEGKGDDFAKPELFQCIVECVSGVCETVDDARADLRGKLIKARDAAKEFGASFLGAGTHPLGKWEEQPITQKDRYKHLVNRMGRPARQMLIMGTHVHVGVDSGEKAIAVMNQISYFLPHLLVLAASSPYSGAREDTNMASWRLKLFEALPTAGLSPQISNWAEQVRLMRTLINAGAIQSIREIWWDVRPHPDFGTVEVRICDSVSTPTEALALAAFIQTLVVFLGEEYDRGSSPNYVRNWSLKENKWRAARYGLDRDEKGNDLCRIICDDQGTTIPVTDDILKTLEEVSEVAERIGSAKYLEVIPKVLKHGASYARQRKTFAETQSYEAVARNLMKEFTMDNPGFDTGVPNFWTNE